MITELDSLTSRRIAPLVRWSNATQARSLPVGSRKEVTLDSALAEALKAYDATEANLAKLERLWAEMQRLIGSGISFEGESKDGIAYEHAARSFVEIAAALPAIGGTAFAVVCFESLDGVAQARWDAAELGVLEIHVSTEDGIHAQGRELREYRYRLRRRRHALVVQPLREIVGRIERTIAELARGSAGEDDADSSAASDWELLREYRAQLLALLGAERPQTAKWSDFFRHLRFAQECDLDDIATRDWPVLRELIETWLRADPGPVPVGVGELDDLAPVRTSQAVPTGLTWSALNDESFERLVYVLVSSTDGYENCQWLTRANAPDRGRDVAATRVVSDSLAGALYLRVIFQCKHWQSRSIAMSDVSTIRDQMSLWEPPTVDVLVFATTGRFTSNAVEFIEKHNMKSRLRIEMWPDSHLELLLAARPDLIADFGLRRRALAP